MPAGRRGGSNPGERRGGRKRGTPNKRTLKQKEELEASGLSPLDYLLNVMRNPEQTTDTRLSAAKAAAPFCHRALARTEHTGPDGGPVQVVGEMVIRFD